MSVRTKADDAAFLAIAQGAAADLCRPGSDYRNPHLASSNNSDAYAIGAWVCYWQGRDALLSVHKSRGYDWKIETRRDALTVRVIKPADHRNACLIAGQGPGSQTAPASAGQLSLLT